MRYTRLLVGTDFSEDSTCAWEHAMQIATRTGAELLVLHACEVGDEEGEGPDCPHGAIEKLGALPARGLDDRVTRSVVHAFPDAAILETARDFGAELVVVGSRGATGFRRLLLGSIAEKVIRAAETDVFVARQRVADGYRRVLVPTDFSGAAEHALEAAIELVADGGSIDVLHAWRVTPRGDSAMMLAEHAELMGAQLLDRHPCEHAAVRFVHTEDAPARGIHRRLDTGDYDLVAMGSHGRHGLRRLVLGSVAEATVRHASCSVLVARAETAG